MLRVSSHITQLRQQNRTRRPLPFSIVPNVRIAQLGAGLRAFEPAPSFSRDKWEQLEALRPRVLVGSAADLHCLAHLAQRHVLELSSVDHAIFAVTRWGAQPVSDVSRVVLWQAFGVPIYELLVDVRGALLAAECEAHEGWHIEPRAKFSVVKGELVLHSAGRLRGSSGLAGSIQTTTCPCGRPGARLLNLEPLVGLVRVRGALAATA